MLINSKKCKNCFYNDQCSGNKLRQLNFKKINCPEKYANILSTQKPD